MEFLDEFIKQVICAKGYNNTYCKNIFINSEIYTLQNNFIGNINQQCLCKQSVHK